MSAGAGDGRDDVVKISIERVGGSTTEAVLTKSLNGRVEKAAIKRVAVEGNEGGKSLTNILPTHNLHRSGHLKNTLKEFVWWEV
jgi:hypothetical protein